MSASIAHEKWSYIVDRCTTWLHDPCTSNDARAIAQRYAGLGLYHLGQYAEARVALKNSLQLEDDTFTLVILARCEIADGNVLVGLCHWIVAIEREPWNYAEASTVAAEHGYQFVKRPTGRNTYGLSRMRSNHEAV